MSYNFMKLFILEMANNHMGDVMHGLEIIEAFHDVVQQFDYRFAFKFQYRALDTFIHPAFKDRMDIKYIKRFTETRLSEDDYQRMKEKAQELGFIAVCTPFDEQSVDLIEQQNFEVLKIASCSFTDWPLLERIAQTDMPIVASTAGASLDEIDNVVSFLQHRDKDFCLMHCVGAYPTLASDMELNQVDFFKNRYPSVDIGFSTHEEPDDTDIIKMAIAKGAVAFERHVGLPTEKYAINAYSSTPKQIQKWLEAACKAYEICGVEGRRRDISDKEKNDLTGLKRGVFATETLCAEDTITPEHTFYAIPCEAGQLLANDMSKYIGYMVKQNVAPGQPIQSDNVVALNKRDKVLSIIRQLSTLIKKSGIQLQNRLELELSHHYGIDEIDRWGCSIINCINREYCKKVIILLPGQENPTHLHKRKEETFHVVYGEVELNLDDDIKTYKAGDMVVVERNKKHSFSSQHGAVFEEISTTHYSNDSFYEDESIMSSDTRKTHMTFWADWLMGDIK